MNNIQKINSQIYFFKNMEDNIISSNNNETIIAVLEHGEVIYNKNHHPNFEYCEEHNFDYYEGKIDSIGIGVLVSGSIVLTVKRRLNGGEALSDKFAKALVNYLISKGLNSVRQDNNDVLVSDYKVASGGESIINGFNYMGYQISINQDIEAIKAICDKDSLKEPKGLSDFGVTTEEIVQFCEEYWSNN